ncbi:hypothetical protein IFM89_028329 [Coptis chinensis]|uniref:Alpha/beta hydrolase fold-3 domain-containing protein n=1 Tax=Coptis chinensis TaxID=261450 RepID=A0A835M213_9MAGN|nr:hypothetical protein IFM89_028329 [Coptis chinensis]
MSGITFEYPPFIRVYEDGSKERLRDDVFIAPSVDPSTGVSSKDVKIKPGDVERLPEKSAFCATYHNFLNLLVEKANVVAISVNYRRAPEYSLPIAFQDSWTSLKWVFSNPKEEWLNNYADFNRVFMGGDSAGATITHNVAVQAAHSELNGKFNGILVVHPYFLGVKPLDSEGDMDLLGKLWTAVYPTTSGLDDPLINPVKDPNFKKLACKKVLVCVAEKDLFFSV